MPGAVCRASIACLLLCLACARPAFADAHRGVASGKRDYATYCAPCHGHTGEGNGPLAKMLVPRPARHSDAAFMNALSDEYLFDLLKDGGPAFGKSPLMGAWSKVLSEERIRNLIAYMRSLVRKVNAVKLTASGLAGANQQ